MKYAIQAIGVMLAIGICGVPLERAQACVAVPAAQRELTATLSRYNEIYESAANSIQKHRLAGDFQRAFCAAIPRGSVSGWVGEVTRIDDDAPGHALNLELVISTGALQSGDLGIQLSLGNTDGWVVSNPNARPMTYASTAGVRISRSSPLYRVVSSLANGDTVIFGGSFVPFSTPQACYATLRNSTYFSLFRFTSIQKIGSNVPF